MRFNGKARREGVFRGVGFHLGAIDVEFPSPHQPCLLALLDNLFKEAVKDSDPMALTDARQTGMIR